MPLYEYVCLACEGPFDARREVDGPDPSCPSCGAARVRRRFSVFAARQTGPARGADPIGRAGGSGACACGGACSCAN